MKSEADVFIFDGLVYVYCAGLDELVPPKVRLACCSAGISPSPMAFNS
jgi:hypothetical protein